MCTVINLSTAHKQSYSCTPKEAVIAAYAQSKKDWNTWDYEKRYSYLIKEGRFTFSCGDFAVFKDGKDF
ncbi:MAG TPA: hypothetical protein DDY71_05250 [Spirochaetia bacterium]|nr:hypothetical protein [Spirochaetia bacterium]